MINGKKFDFRDDMEGLVADLLCSACLPFLKQTRKLKRVLTFADVDVYCCK